MGANFLWLATDNVLAIVNGLLVGAVVARYLGPEQLGVLAFAAAIMLLAAPFVSFGGDTVIMREFVNNPDRESLYWTTFFGRILFGLLTALVVVVGAATGLIEAGSRTEFLVILISVVPLIFTSFDVTRLMLSADHLNRIAVVAANSVLVIFALVKLALVYWQQSLLWFAAAASLQTIFTSVAIYYVTQRMGNIPSFRMPDKQLLGRLLYECWPLILSGLSVALYMNVDFIMVRLLDGVREAGIYAVAVKLSVLFYFLPGALSTTFLPWLAKSYSLQSNDVYLVNLKKYFEINVLFSYFCIAGAILLFPTLLLLLFGPAFEGSIPIFRMHIFGLIFVFLGSARTIHLNLSRLHHFQMLSTAAGMLVNVVLNWILIPKYHGEGAALSTVISLAVAGLISTFCYGKLTRIGVLQVASMVTAPFNAVRLLRITFNPK